ncbi:MAG: nucleotidyltransferase domain-containing protein [Bacteroidaceae bacterium]|nr:nucleotidyltransferase domain-containing protein [Bacteroidaceae bacterium]
MLQLEECKTKLAEFKTLFGEKFGVIRIGIFGSVARHQNTPESDIDIVVELRNPNYSLMCRLREHLQNMFDCKVDLLRFRDSLRPMLKYNLQKETIYV